MGTGSLSLAWVEAVALVPRCKTLATESPGGHTRGGKPGADLLRARAGEEVCGAGPGLPGEGHRQHGRVRPPRGAPRGEPGPGPGQEVSLAL